MSELDDPNTVTVTMEDDGYLSMTMKRSAEDGEEEEGIEEPDGKRLRLEIAEGENGQHIIQQVQEIEEHPDLHVEEGQIIQDPISEGVVVEEEVIQQQPAPQYQNLIIQHMDIAEPLSTLKQLLELRLQCSLAEHQFFLQDSIPSKCPTKFIKIREYFRLNINEFIQDPSIITFAYPGMQIQQLWSNFPDTILAFDLDTEKSLVDQCVHGDGMVQINLEVKSQPGLKPKINILDILKPAEEVESNGLDQSDFQSSTATVASQSSAPAKVVVPLSDETENITRWIVDQNFRRDQERLKIPFDPVQWTEVHVRHWIQWAVKEFGLENVDVTNFSMNGQQLCEMSHPEFVKFIPNDKGDIFWTHLELLRKCKFVAVMQQPAPHAVTTITVSTSGKKSWKQNKNRSPRITGDHGFSPGNRTGNNGQIQLWQFLLELLTDKDCREVIQWIGDEGEFKLNNPEMVAQMWGQRKNKPTMNYEKLSRALRYYYDGDMIAKVHGKRFVYKFVCDLKMLLGYSAGELNRQVTMCAEKKLQRVRETLRPQVSKRTIDVSKMTAHTVQTMD